MADAPISEELAVLRKRARRRLVGAIALVAVALLVLWTVMDDQPPPGLASTPITIVSEGPKASAAAEPVAPVPSPTRPAPAGVENSPPPAQPQPEPLKPVAPMPALPVPEPKPVPPVTKPVERPPETPKPVPTAEAPREPKPVSVPDPQRILEGAESKPQLASAESASPVRILLQVGAFAEAAKVASLKEKIAGAGLPVMADQVTTAKGELTRVRVGPFTTRDAAEKAHARLAAAGVPSQIVGK